LTSEAALAADKSFPKGELPRHFSRETGAKTQSRRRL